MNSTGSLWRRAERYLRENQILPARAVLEAILAKDPDQPRAHLVLGGIAWKQDKIRQAIGHALAASRCRLASADMVCDVIAALIQTGESAAANRLFEHPELKRGNLAVPLLMRLSGQAQANGEHVRALSLLQSARESGASGADFLCYLGVQLTFNGKMSEAKEALEACTRLDPAAGRAGLILSRLGKQSDEHNHLKNLADGLARVRRGTDEHAALEFARYKELEDLKRYAEGWQALRNANQIMRDLLKHDVDAESTSMARLAELTSSWSPPPEERRPEGPYPIFIIGMPRSGTTVLDRILGNHSRVTSVGELSDFGRQMRWAADHCTPLMPDLQFQERLKEIDFAELGRRYLDQTRWRAGSKQYYVDKLPANWVVSGLIAHALPSAKILHLVRNPADTCFSNYRAMFGDSYPYSYDLDHLVRHYSGYLRMMSHWHRVMPNRIMDVSYGELVDDPPGVARKVLEFCGLDFEAGCTEVDKNPAAVATLSMVQARESIHAKGFGQWRAYAEWLEPSMPEIFNSQA